MKKKTILFVPGFLCDTFCTIENRTMELTEELFGDYNILWLVSKINNPYNVFQNYENRGKLAEPLYVSELKKRKINFIEVNLSKYNFLKNLFIFHKIFKENNVDAVFVEFGFERFYAPLFAKIFGKKVIWYEHWNSLEMKFSSIKKLFYKIFVDDFIAISKFIGDTLPKNKPVYVVINSKKIEDISNLDEELRQQTKEELGLNKFDNIILMVAAFREMKRHDLALKIVEKVKQKSNKKIGFVFLGKGELYEKYIKIVKENNLENIIVMPGHSLQPSKYYIASDIHMLTSLREPFGTCLIEAMNYKLPLINFDSPSSREIIVPEETGYLIEPENIEDFADKIIELVENPAKRIILGENGYKRLLENFDIKVWRVKMKETFNKII